MRFLLLLCLLFCQLTIEAQSLQNIEFSLSEGERYAFSLDTADVYAFTAIALTFEEKAAPEAVFIRSKSTHSTWSNWQTIPKNAHKGAKGITFGQLYIEAPNTLFEVRIEGSSQASGLLQTYSPIEYADANYVKNIQLTIPKSLQLFEAGNSCTCPQPAYISRASWGGPPNQQAGCTPNFSPVTHLVVHHEASTPVPPYAAAVKSIWQFHTGNQGWCDIAYNWLIAPDGVLYEGRAGGDDVIGAHFCGNNSGTMGVCLLGNFETDQPTAAALATLEKLLAWKACASGILPDSTSVHTASGKQLPHIVGHRLGCATLCPGTFLFDKLAAVQAKVDSLYNDPTGCDGIYPPQNDACSAARVLQSGSTCTFTLADVEGASPSGIPIPACTGFTSPTALDVWFEFEATSPSEVITVRPQSGNLAGLDPVIALYEGDCSALNLLDCSDSPGGAGGTGNLIASNLIIGQRYLVRVYDFGSTPPADPAFEICVRQQTVSVEEVGVHTSVLLFPNPTKTQFQIQGAADASIFRVQVFDALGRLIFSEKNASALPSSIDCSAWAKGIYRVQITGENGLTVRSLLKE